MTRTLINNKNMFWGFMISVSCVLVGYCCGILTGIKYNSVLNPTFFSGVYFICIFLCVCFLVLFINGMDKQLKEK